MGRAPARGLGFRSRSFKVTDFGTKAVCTAYRFPVIHSIGQTFAFDTGCLSVTHYSVCNIYNCNQDEMVNVNVLGFVCEKSSNAI